MFKPRIKPSTKIETIFEPPKTLITPLAYSKMSNIVDLCDKEVGWLSTAYWQKEQNLIIIDDVFIFKQEVNSATCEITEEGLSEFAEELLKLKNGIETWNNIRVWGHSHAKMGVTPSLQDDKQMEVFNNGNDWFLRIIANKDGEMKIDLYDFTINICYLDMPWSIYIPEIFTTREQIKEEIKEKVKEKKYTTYPYTNYTSKSTDKITSKVTQQETQIYNEIEKEEEKEYYLSPNGDYLLDLGYGHFETLTECEVEKIACASYLSEAKIIIHDLFNMTYTSGEIYNMWRICKEIYNDILYETYWDYNLDKNEKEENKNEIK